jgi:hypothetical protein
MATDQSPFTWMNKYATKISRLKPSLALVVAAVALVVALGDTAVAATGGSLILGKSNKATTPTSVANTGAGTALKLHTSSSKTPDLSISNKTEIKNLNSNLLDGLDSSQLQRPLTSGCSTGSFLRSVNQSGTPSCASPAAESASPLSEVASLVPAATTEPVGFSDGNVLVTVASKQFTAPTDGIYMLVGSAKVATDATDSCDSNTAGDAQVTWAIDSMNGPGNWVDDNQPSGSTLGAGSPQVLYLTQGPHNLAFTDEGAGHCSAPLGNATISDLEAHVYLMS